MVSLFCKPNDTIIAARNAHISFINIVVLLGLNVEWVLPLYNDSDGVSGEVQSEDIEKAIIKNRDAKAVYITSPDYLGVMSDIKSIARVCKKYGVVLIVDNAHGAHLKFLSQDIHPLTLGATVCCDSAHKTLPALTSSAYLHISKDSDVSYEQCKRAMSVYGSTSPSYLTLMSLDLCNKYLYNSAKSDFAELSLRSEKLYEAMKKQGIPSVAKNMDITKLTVSLRYTSLSFLQVLELLEKNKIEPEYISEQYIVFMISPQNTKEDFEALHNFISGLVPMKNEQVKGNELFRLPQSELRPRQAYFMEKENISINDSVGRICAENKILCPPGVPIITCGEIINEQTKNLLKRSSILTINVVK
ncbi:MAG: aminotransferase class I/II-fold pyridoxal phosphate-dependent enzyme [Oscillospiraceae bacterium]